MVKRLRDFFRTGHTQLRSTAFEPLLHDAIDAAARQPRRFRGPVETLHHVLAGAALVFGESPTVAAEAAMLGAPAVVVSTSRRSYLDELERRYGLVSFHGHRRRGQAEALARAEELLRDPGTPAEWSRRRAVMLAEQEDVAGFVTDVVLGRRGPA